MIADHHSFRCRLLESRFDGLIALHDFLFVLAEEVHSDAYCLDFPCFGAFFFPFMFLAVKAKLP
jgi:hypothetical protein